MKNKLTFIRPQSGQSPLAIKLGWEEKIELDYWWCVELKKLYKPVKNGFAEIEIKSLDSLIEDCKKK